jgi:glycosyltransferase involved in cell wall biosynthesis
LSNLIQWKDFCRQIPWVATVQTCNNDWTIYASLQQACKQFDAVLVIDDGSTDNTLLEVDRFIRREKPQNLHVFDLSSIDPWPEMKAPKREGMEPTEKTQAKSKFKSYSLVKQLATNCMWISIESDVIIADDARSRMLSRVEKWTEPQTDCEFFNLVMTIDPWHVRSVSLSEEKYVKPEGIKHRREYDHPGDWGLALSWIGGELYPGPDPVHPYGPNFLPWLHKNQLGKKGQDDSSPFGFHMLSYRESEKDADYSSRRFFKIEDIKDDAVDWNLLKRVRFPVLTKLNELGQREVISCEW